MKLEIINEDDVLGKTFAGDVLDRKLHKKMYFTGLSETKITIKKFLK